MMKTVEKLDSEFVIQNSGVCTVNIYNFGVEDAYGMEKGYRIETFRLKGDERFAFQGIAVRTSLGITTPRGSWSPVYFFTTAEERAEDIQTYVKAVERRAKRNAAK
jgi:hypothetical protein